MSDGAWADVVVGLRFPEGLRWCGDHLYFSDVFGAGVWRVSPGDVPELLGTVPGRPSGLGVLADGSVLAVSMRDQRVVRVAPDAPEPVADLSGSVVGDCNDMLVDAHGRMYVGCFGYDFVGGAPRRAACLVRADPDGTVRVVAEDVWFPNGMALTPDGATLLLAESSAERITAFTVLADGSLAGRRVFAELPGRRPDGIALDAEGALWVAPSRTPELLRVRDGGEVVACIPSPGDQTHAVALGGPDGRTLFVAASPTHDEAASAERKAVIVAMPVVVPAA